MFNEKKEKARNKMLRALMCIWYYIRYEMTPVSVGGEQQISISPGAGMFLAEN